MSAVPICDWNVHDYEEVTHQEDTHENVDDEVSRKVDSRGAVVHIENRDE